MLDWYYLVENLRSGLGHQHPRVVRALELARAGRAYDLIQLLERATRRLEDPEQIPPLPQADRLRTFQSRRHQELSPGSPCQLWPDGESDRHPGQPPAQVSRHELAPPGRPSPWSGSDCCVSTTDGTSSGISAARLSAGSGHLPPDQHRLLDASTDPVVVHGSGTCATRTGCSPQQVKTSQAVALRSRIILRSLAGRSNTQVATELGITGDTVGK